MSHSLGLKIQKVGRKVMTSVISLATGTESNSESFRTAEEALADVERREKEFREETDGLGYETLMVGGFTQDRQAVERTAVQKSAVQPVHVPLFLSED